MSVTREQLEPKIVNVRRGLAQVKEETESVGSDTVRAQLMGAYATLAKAIDSWSTKQRDEVIAGTRPLARWQEYGDDLLLQLSRYVREAGSFLTQWSRAAEVVGTASDAVLRPVEAKVADLRKQLDQLTKAEAAWRQQRDVLAEARPRLSPEVVEVYWGDPAARAQAALHRFRQLVGGLEIGVRALREGKAPSFEELSKGLGNPFVGAAGALAVIAIAAALATSLWAFFRHADEVTRAELIQKGHGDVVIKLDQIELEKKKVEKGWSTGEVVVAVVVVASVVGGVAWLIRRQLKLDARRPARRAAAPTPKRAKTAQKRRASVEAHA